VIVSSSLQHCVWILLCSDADAVEDDDVSDPEYSIVTDDVDDDDEEERRNDKATRVSSMLI